MSGRLWNTLAEDLLPRGTLGHAEKSVRGKLMRIVLLTTAIALLAAGIGMLWALVDEDGLTWHDHISGTFPTIVSED